MSVGYVLRFALGLGLLTAGGAAAFLPEEELRRVTHSVQNMSADGLGPVLGSLGFAPAGPFAGTDAASAWREAAAREDWDEMARISRPAFFARLGTQSDWKDPSVRVDVEVEGAPQSVWLVDPVQGPDGWSGEAWFVLGSAIEAGETLTFVPADVNDWQFEKDGLIYGSFAGRSLFGNERSGVSTDPLPADW